MSPSIIQASDLKHLAENGFVVVEDFLSNDLYESLREDVKNLRDIGKFQIAKIDQLQNCYGRFHRLINSYL